MSSGPFTRRAMKFKTDLFLPIPTVIETLDRFFPGCEFTPAKVDEDQPRIVPIKNLSEVATYAHLLRQWGDGDLQRDPRGIELLASARTSSDWRGPEDPLSIILAAGIEFIYDPRKKGFEQNALYVVKGQPSGTYPPLHTDHLDNWYQLVVPKKR